MLLKAINEALGLSPPEPLRSLLNHLPHSSPDLPRGRYRHFFSIESDPRTVYTNDKEAAARSGEWMPYLQDALANLEIFEGIIPWMYLDTKGFVTVAVGELLANSASAVALAFVDANNQPSTPDAIQAEYSRVSALPPGRYPAAFYRSPASPTLPHPAIDALLLHHLTYFDTQLSQRFASYLAFPDPAKLGLLDMVYNLGVTGLFRGFPTFMNYVQNKNWAGAATQCHRNGPSLQRNDWTRQQFLAAAAASAAPGNTGS